MSKTVTAIFDTRPQAEEALTRLEAAGFTREHVTMLVSEETRGKHFTIVDDNKSDEGAVAGGAIGGLIGALYMGLASAGSIFIPGLNLIVSGALMGTLAGLGAGAVAGGLAGALAGWNIPEHEARVYEEKIRTGAILIGVDVVDDEDVERVESILKETEAKNVAA